MVESDDSEFVGEIIRCKDCQNFKQMPIDRHGHQPYWCENLNIYLEGPDWFCADGVMRTIPHWIFGNTRGHSWMKCSECCVSQSGQTGCWAYCPNCGAEMKGDTEVEIN